MKAGADILDAFHAVVAGDPAVDRDALFTRCRADAPIFFSEPLDAWVLTRYDDVRAVLEDDAYRTLTDGPGATIVDERRLYPGRSTTSSTC